MKTKYFLRGLGVGLILATVLLFVLYSYKMSDNKIIQRAKELGMVYAKEETTQMDEKKTEKSEEETTEEKKEDTETDTKDTQKESEEETSEEEKTTSNTEIKMTISEGMSSMAVCNMLEDTGVVDSAKKFDEYLIEKGYESDIQNGEYSFKTGMSYEEIADIIIK